MGHLSRGGTGGDRNRRHFPCVAFILQVVSVFVLLPLCFVTAPDPSCSSPSLHPLYCERRGGGGEGTAVGTKHSAVALHSRLSLAPHSIPPLERRVLFTCSCARPRGGDPEPPPPNPLCAIQSNLVQRGRYGHSVLKGCLTWTLSSIPISQSSTSMMCHSATLASASVSV